MHIIKRACLAPMAAALAFAGFAAPGAVCAAGYPEKTVKLIVAFPPGGISDITARIVAPKLTDILGRSVIIENRAGAGGNVGAQAVAIAAPDGYTFLVTTTAFAVNPALWGKDAGYSAEQDFVPVSLVSTQPNVIVVNQSVPARTLAELKTLASRRSLAYATPGLGTTPALSADNLFGVIWKSNMTSVPYRGAGPAAVAVLAGETPVASVALASVVPYLKSGKVRALAVTSRQRVASLPDVPTLYELGYTNIEDDNWTAVLAPKGTPSDDVRIISDAIDKALATPEVKQLFESQALTAGGGTPDQFKAYLTGETARWAGIVKATGAKRD
jgi:tripartite-type tricarboxylate transporter receptor subunit TctC